MEDNLPLIKETVGHLRFLGHFLHYQMGCKYGRRRILSILLEHDGELLQKELQDILRIQSGSLSEIIIKIEADGLIEKARSEKDARQILLRLTPRGEELARSYKAEHEAKLRELMSCLSDEEMRELCATLERLETHWRESV